MPSGIFSLVFDIWSRFKQARIGRLPVKDKLLRPPGESCRRKVEELNDQIGELSIWLIGFPATPAVLGAFGWKLIGLLNERDNWRLGFSGERAVGEQLNQLMCEGCRVFHDFPLAENWNIDHIVVAPSGIFAIETKAKRKGAASHLQQGHEVIYDGKTLQFPYYTDTRNLAQTRNQATRLAAWLNPRLKSPVTVQPILALPGWYVISRALGDVIVLNPKVLDAAIITPGLEPLSPERIREIFPAD